jgi:adenine phosphoribosyltransferase
MTHKESYGLEYGEDSLEIQAASLPEGSRTIIVDDVLATGGTILAATSLVNQVGGIVVGTLCLLEIQGLGGQIELEKKHLASKFVLSL